jgi:hypothetical protein
MIGNLEKKTLEYKNYESAYKNYTFLKDEYHRNE